ncbi:hypothetical protein KQX54_014634 [Cotesia glomerata]|uniref:Uncharacterized protein n=1 Tax=Cotesia glomerata TaxID=32391 RepID=A0AAV7HRG5_COTGL|nr:hypothetical protein KQX54_014634 [Cotesia glomerata]
MAFCYVPKDDLRTYVSLILMDNIFEVYQWFKFSINIQVFFDRSIFTSFVCQRWAIRKMRIVECREGGAGQMCTCKPIF